ncbi:MAG TPA: HNH endonuclease signature motif containing protein, partial [Steroidobacteraceae bacterium]|nr:HNH endonuclease signature motif containing protein [Steroidobacteraceae bacterium]
ATYKYALLIALVDLSIEKGDDSGRELTLGITELADKFAELYWRQAAPYSSSPLGGSGFVLHQNCGKQAVAIRMLGEMRKSSPSLSAARRTKDWRRLVGRMRRLLKDMPLWRLQLLRSERLEFLYRPGPASDQITLLPWVGHHLRQRALLIRRLAQTEWLGFLLSLRQNAPLLGEAVGLSEFLFGSDRAAAHRKVIATLRDLQHGNCFYCQRGLRTATALDHFIPWSRYPRDLAHNFVLAHPSCNGAKKDTLAGETHLGRWTKFISENDKDLSKAGQAAGLLVSRPTVLSVARWSYESADRANAQVWLHGAQQARLTGDWRRLLCE